MAYLIDTSILARLANTADAQHAAATRAVLELHRTGEILHVTSQVLIEFRNVATRPVNMNGLGLSPIEAQTLAAGFEMAFPILAESPDIFPAWKAVVEGLAITGKQVHDARLVAVCHAAGTSHLLSFNSSHFQRMASFAPGVVIVDPKIT